MLNIDKKKYRNLQEQVGYNSQQIKKIFSVLDGIDYEDHVVVIEDISIPLNEEEMEIIAQPVSFLVYQDKLYFKNSTESSKAYYSAVINLLGTSVIIINEPIISVDLNTGELTLDDISSEVYSKEKVDEIDLNLQNLISDLADGSPKGAYATLEDLQTAYPTGIDGIYVVSADNHWYYWNGNAWTDGGLYLSSDVSGDTINLLNEITNQALEITQKGNVSISPTLVDGYVNYTNGNISDNSYGGLYKRTGYIPILSNSHLTSIIHDFSFTNNSNDGYAFFDEDKAFISGGKTQTIAIIPVNAKFIVLTNYNIGGVHTQKTLTINYDYQNFDGILNTINLNINEILDGRINGKKEETPALVDGFINKNTGNVSDNSYGGLYNRTDYIEIPSGTFTITHNFVSQDAGGWAFYDNTKTFISGGDANTITNIPANAKFIALTDYDSLGVHAGKYVNFNLIGICSVDISTLKFVSYGDSIVAQDKWQPYLVAKYGFEHTKLGVGSSPVAYHAATEDQYPCFVNATRIQGIKDADPDILVIMGGTNDAHYQIPIGTDVEFSKALASKDQTTFKGAYSYLIETLLTWKPTLKIILMTPMSSQYHASFDYPAYAQAVRDVAHYYSLCIADTNRESGISAFDYNTYTSDGLHPNEAGGNRIANIVAQKLNMIYYIKY